MKWFDFKMKGIMMNRQLFSGCKKCNSNCQYCFAKWNDDYTGNDYFDISKIDLDTDVIYPSCDTEDLFLDETIDKIKEFIYKNNRKIVICYSIKNEISKRKMEKIKLINEELIGTGMGFVKIGISIATKSMLEELEKGTLPYNERLYFLKMLKDFNIPCSAILKPVLPFIPFSEYKQIIDDVFVYTDMIVIGGLYVNEKTDFYKRYIENKFPVETRKVNWLESEPKWKYVENIYLNNAIKKYIVSLGKEYFESDMDFVKKIYTKLF